MTAGPYDVLRGRSDAQLLARFRGGDDGAFDLLHQRHGATIRSYAAFMLRGTPHDPDDAAQDVFLRAYEALRRDERPVDVRPWLFRVAHNRCIDALRRPAPAELHDHHHAAAADPQAGHEQRESLRALLRDIGALPERQRSALLLRELGGLSHEAVADALGISVSASKMLVVRARMTLTEAAEARGATCEEVRMRMAAAADAGRRPRRADARHARECPACAACQRARASLERELALLPGGGAGLFGLFGAITGAGGGTKVAATLCCAVAGAGALTTTQALRPERVPPPAQERPAGPAAPAAAPRAATASTAAFARRPALAALQAPSAGARGALEGRGGRARHTVVPAGDATPAQPQVAQAPPAERVDLEQIGDPAPESPPAATTPQRPPSPGTSPATPTPERDAAERIDLAALNQGDE